MTLPDSDDFDSLGGEIFNHSDVENPTTDLDASFNNITRANVAGMSRVVVRSYVELDGYTESAADHNAVYGNGFSVAPIVSHMGTGEYLITFPETIVDALGVERALNIKQAWADPYFASTRLFFARVVRESPHELTVWIVTSSNTRTDMLEDESVLVMWI